jgi:hypothetical protein
MPHWGKPRRRNNGFNPGTTLRTKDPREVAVSESRWFIVPAVDAQGKNMLRVEYQDPRAGRWLVHTFQAPETRAPEGTEMPPTR